MSVFLARRLSDSNDMSMDTPQEELLRSLSSIFASGRFSDVTVICQDRRYMAHKALLCPRSAFFDGACTAGFLETTNGEIDLSEEDEEVVDHMMHYFYHLNYLTGESTAGKPSELPLRSNRSGVPAGNSFNLTAFEDPLMAMASAAAAAPSARPDSHSATRMATQPGRGGAAATAGRLAGSAKHRSPSPPSMHPNAVSQRRARSRKSCRDSEGSPQQASTATGNESETEDGGAAAPDIVIHARVYAMAEKYGIPGLKVLAKRKFERMMQENWGDEELPLAMEEVYEGTIEEDRGLRDVIVQVFRSHPDLAWRPDIQKTVQSLAPLAFDLHRVQSGIPIKV